MTEQELLVLAESTIASLDSLFKFGFILDDDEDDPEDCGELIDRAERLISDYYRERFPVQQAVITSEVVERSA